MENKEKAFLPIMIDLQKFGCLVIGGGEVAYRKTQNILEFNGTATVISPEFVPELQNLIDSGKIKAIKRKYERGDVNDFDIIFCAAGDEAADNMVKQDSDIAGKLLNVADVPELCNFIMPATIKRGAFILALSSQGEAPFYVKEKRQQIQSMISPMIADITTIAGVFRRRLMDDERFENPERRYELFQQFLKVPWEEILYEHGLDGAYERMEELFQ